MAVTGLTASGLSAIYSSGCYPGADKKKLYLQAGDCPHENTYTFFAALSEKDLQKIHCCD